MSVINRMLADLENRAGDQAAGAPDLSSAGEPARRRPTGRGLTTVLAVALLAVAVVLWIQRAPDAVALLAGGAGAEPADGSRTTQSATPDGEVAADSADGHRDDQPELAAAADPLHATLTGLRFEIDSERESALVLVFADAEPPAVAPPRVENGALEWTVPAGGSGISVPAPPSGQNQFRDLAVTADQGATRLRVRLATDVRVGLQRGEEGRLRLTARSPEADPPEEVVTDAGSASAGEDVGDEPESQAEAGQRTDERQGADEAVAQGDDSAGEPEAADPGNSDESGEADNTPAEATAVGQGGADDGDQGIRADPESAPEVRARRRYSDARDALATGDIRRARLHLEEALEADPDLHSAREVLVALLRRGGDDNAAREVLAEGIERAPARVAYAKPYARLLLDVDELERARGVLEQARVNGRGDIDFHALAANVARRLGRHERAIAEYTAALEIDSGRASLWLGLGISLAAAGHDEQARAAFREARGTGRLSDRMDRWVRDRIEDLEGR